MQSEKMERILDLAATLAGRSDELDQVLIIYREKPQHENAESSVSGSMDNGLTLEQSLWLAESFKTWLTLGAIGVLPRKD